jgi:hypothetical protein
MPDSVSDKQKQVSDRMLISSITQYLTVSSKVTKKNVAEKWVVEQTHSPIQDTKMETSLIV